MAKPRPWKRTFIVNNRLQITIMVYSLILAICVSVVNLVIESLLVRNAANLNSTFTFLCILASLFVIFGVVVIFGFVLTNRIAGPVHRLKLHMEGVVEGKSDEDMKFRQNDYFSEVLIPYNILLKKFRDAKAIK